MIKKIFSVVVFVFYLFAAQGQDIIFSQAYVSGSYLNPALTGLFNGFVRVSTQYREQGRGALDHTLKTYVVSADIKYHFKMFNKFSEDVLGVGLYYLNDRVEVYDFNTNIIQLSLSYHKALGFRSNQYLGIGFQGGVVQKNINREYLTFEDQFNQVDDYSYSTAEPLIANNFAFGDFSLGIYYTVSPTVSTKVEGGLAIQHFAGSNVSFYRNSKEIENESILKTKYTVHGSFTYKTKKFITYQPRFRFIKQGVFMDLELGSNVKISSFNWDLIALHFGLGAHLINDLDSYTLGTVVPFFGLQYKNFMLGFSYDVSLTHLIYTHSNFNTFEFSARYLGEQTNEGLVCPEF